MEDRMLKDFTDNELAGMVRRSIYAKNTRFDERMQFLLVLAVPYGKDQEVDSWGEAIGAFARLLQDDDWVDREFQIYDHAAAQHYYAAALNEAESPEAVQDLDLESPQNISAKIDWIYQVTNGDTVLGFQEWLQHQQEADRLSPAEAQQHQAENLVAALLSGKTIEGTADLQAVKDHVSTLAHGMTLAQALEKGICIACKELAAPKCHTADGHGEYRISGMCEECFDKMAEEADREDEARYPICPECLTSLEFLDSIALPKTGSYRKILDHCEFCGLEFGVKSTEEVKPIE